MGKKRFGKGNRVICMALASMLSVMLLAGCGASKDAAYAVSEEAAMDMQNGMAYDDVYYKGAESSDMEEVAVEEAVEEAEMEEDMADTTANGTAEDLSQSVASNRKLIKRVNLSVETQEFDVLTAKIEEKVTSLGGYMENSDVYGNGYSSNSMRRANYTARIPVNKLDELVNSVDNMSNVTSKSESAEDVTLEYVDTKSRKEALLIEQERLMALLEQADTLETIVGLESRLTEVRYEIQSLESRLRTFDNLVDFATVYIDVTEVVIYTPTETPEKTIWQKMADGFVSSLKDVGYGFVDFFVGLVIALPYLFVWAVVIGIIILIVRAVIKSTKKKKVKRQKRLEEQLAQSRNMLQNSSVTPVTNAESVPEDAKEDKKEEKEEKENKQ